jgi:hypothetical protein
MRTHALIRMAVILSVAGLTSAALAASEEDYKAAYAKAEAADKEAAKLKHQWSTTAGELKAAKKAAEAGKFDDAVKHASHAEELAKASVHQGMDEQKNWMQAIIR